MFALKIFGGFPTQFAVFASKPWQMSAVCKNFSVRHPLGVWLLTPVGMATKFDTK